MPKLEIRKKDSTAEVNRRKAAMTQELMENAGYNPIEAMMEMAQDDGIQDVQFKFSIHRELAKYYSPQLRAVDVTGGMDNSLNITVVNYTPPAEKEEKEVAKPAIDHESTVVEFKPSEPLEQAIHDAGTKDPSKLES